MGLCPLDPDGVPPLSLALRGADLLYRSRKSLGSVQRLSVDASLGTDKMASGDYGPSLVQGQSPWP
jgi:hypothetical protein